MPRFSSPILISLAALTIAGAGVFFVARLDRASAESPLAITAGGFHTCILTSAQGVQCWGQNGLGQLGDGSTVDSTTPVDVAGLGTTVTAVSAGGYHTCALTSAGGVKCWGRNGFGQLGDGTTAMSASPVDVSGLINVVAISSGGFHTCALTSTGVVKCWGQNNSGQLGDGTMTHRSAPVDVTGLPADMMDVSAGGSELLGGGHTCGVTDAGGVLCWGRNDFGQLGDGTNMSSLVPVVIAGLSGVTTVHAGRWHSCALVAGGAAKCWGSNAAGQLGDGSLGGASNTPVDVAGLGAAAQAAAGGLHNCVRTASSGVQCWGFNDVGQVGDGTSSTVRPTPVDVLESPGGSALTNVASVAAGGSVNTSGHSCALMVTGAVKCWGNNDHGQLGDGTNTNRSTPVDVVGLGPKETATPTVTDTPVLTATPTPTVTDTPVPTATPVPPTPTESPPSTLDEMFDELADGIDELEVRSGVRRSLSAKIEAAAERAERNHCSAINTLNALTSEIEALLRSGRIGEEDAASLLTQIDAIIEALVGEGPCRGRR